MLPTVLSLFLAPFIFADSVAPKYLHATCDCEILDELNQPVAIYQIAGPLPVLVESLEVMGEKPLTTQEDINDCRDIDGDLSLSCTLHALSAQQSAQSNCQKIVDSRSPKANRGLNKSRILGNSCTWSVSSEPIEEASFMDVLRNIKFF